MVAERLLGEPIHECRQVRVAVVHVGADVGFLNGRIAEEPVGEAGGVAHQVLHRHRALGVHQAHPVRAGRVRHSHLHLGKCRKIFGHRIIQLQLTRFEQSERSGHGDGLAHGVDAEDVVHTHGGRALRVSQAEGVFVGDLAVAHDDQDGAGHDVVRHVLVEGGGDHVELVRVDADAGRVAPRQLGSGGELA